ncbi:MAG: FtsX-like permease family protein [Bacteroidales bacterium]|nr:FtsX-like permease family protein [Bacteroidales bacterium]
MRSDLYIAKRYLFARKSHQIINLISIISVIGVMLTTAALIIVLSVFNGFEKLVISLFNSFNPELIIQAKQGKTFHLDDFPSDQIKQTEGLTFFCPIIEENGLIKYKDRQAIITLKGVDSSFIEMSQIDTVMAQGHFILEEERKNYAVLGYGVAYKIQSRLSDFHTPIQFFVPDKSKSASARLEDSFKKFSLFPSGYFSVRQDYDESFVFVPYHLLQNMMEQEDLVTSIELGLSPNTNPEDIKIIISEILGPDFIVKNRLEQQAVLLKVMQSEKAMVYLILGFILLIATFNIIGSISMLIVDKKYDMTTLKALGAGKRLIIRIFAIEGLMISLTGGLAGLILGGFIAFLQQEFGLISLGKAGSGFVVSSYPVYLIFFDFIKVFLMVISMSILAVIYPLRQLARQL